VEELTYRTNLSSFSPEDVVLICDGDKIIGYCWTGITDDGEAASGERKGRIFMLGADPDYRGKGVGKRVLLAGLTHLKSKGLRVAELTVDSENKAACALYGSLGFEVRTSSLWYEKLIN
jgi:mycothiol synthase